MNPFAWLLSKISPVPTLEYERVKHSAPNDESKRRLKFAGDPERHRLPTKHKPLTLRRRGVA